MRHAQDAPGLPEPFSDQHPSLPHLQQAACRLPQPDTRPAGGRARVPQVPGRGDGEGVPEPFQEPRRFRLEDEGDDAAQSDFGRISEVGGAMSGVRPCQHYFSAFSGGLFCFFFSNQRDYLSLKTGKQSFYLFHDE